MTTNLYPAAEPTLYDVIDAMQAGFARIENQFIQMREYVDRRFDALQSQFDKLQSQVDTLHAKIEALTSEVRLVQRGQTRFDYLFENIDDTVLNHEERITVLEKR